MPSTTTPYFDELFDAAAERGYWLLIENREGLLFLKIATPELGTIAMWPAFEGSVEATARYAIRCFEQFRKASS